MTEGITEDQAPPPPPADGDAHDDAPQGPDYPALARARIGIERRLTEAGWLVQDFRNLNVKASLGVAVRDFELRAPYGKADYLLFVQGRVVGVVEARPAESELGEIDVLSAEYTNGIPPGVVPARLPLPLRYESNGDDIRYTDTTDEKPHARRLFWFHRPNRLAEWLERIARNPVAPAPPPPRSAEPRYRIRIDWAPELPRLFGLGATGMLVIAAGLAALFILFFAKAPAVDGPYYTFGVPDHWKAVTTPSGSSDILPDAGGASVDVIPDSPEVAESCPVGAEPSIAFDFEGRTATAHACTGGTYRLWITHNNRSVELQISGLDSTHSTPTTDAVQEILDTFQWKS